MWTTKLWRNPLAFCFSYSEPSYLLGTLLAVIGSRPPWSQVARKLISPLPSPPFPPHSEIPTPWGFPELNAALLRWHRNTGLHVQNRYIQLLSQLQAHKLAIWSHFILLSTSSYLKRLSHQTRFAQQWHGWKKPWLLVTCLLLSRYFKISHGSS